MLKSILKGLAALLALLLIVIGGVVFWASMKFSAGHGRTYTAPPVRLSLSVRTADTARGRRLVKVLHACVECHGMDLGGGGKVMDDPLAGSIYGPNITPAALKDWTDGEVARAIRDGIGRDGKPLVIMPSEDFHHLCEKDLVDIIAYVRSVPPVQRANRPIRVGPLIKFFYARRMVPQLLAAESLDPADAFVPRPAETANPAYGRYLYTTLCIGCHMPDHRGGKIPGTPPDWAAAANITPDALGTWDEATFLKTMRTGVDPSGHTLQLPMTMILKYSKDFTDTELKAIWIYLQQPVTGEAKKDF